MSRTTRSSEKAQPETLSKRVSPVKEKNSEKKPPAVPRKRTAAQTSAASTVRTIHDSGKSKTAQQEPAAAKKSTPITAGQASQTTIRIFYDDAPSQLLRRTKTTASALVQLEKGIELIHRKDFKKASAELQSLVEKYPNETEITASARRYLDICRRSEVRQKKTPATHDQTYAMGVLEHNKTNYDKAVAYFRQSLEKHPRADYIYYSIAASLALKGNIPAAIENLRMAVDLNKDSRVHAKNDPDFAGLENHKEFLELVGAGASAHRRI